MKELTEIKSQALELFDKDETRTIIDFLNAKLESVDFGLHNELILFYARLNRLERENAKGLITGQYFEESKIRLQDGLKYFVQNLDKPPLQITSDFSFYENITNKQLLVFIFLLQLLILIGIGFLILYR